MPRRSDRIDGIDEIDQLLAEGRLGGPARDRVLERVLGSLPEAEPTARRGARRGFLWLGLGTFAAAGAIAAVLIARPRGAGEDAMRAKGAAGDLRATSVTPLCAGKDGVCRTGDRLMFRVDASPDRAFMLAYADPLDGAVPRQDGRIWIFPTSSGESPEIVPAAEPFFLRRAVEIDSSFPKGRYLLTIVLRKRALTRDEGPRASDAVRLTSTLVVE